MNDQLFAVEHGERTGPGLKAAPVIFQLHRCAHRKIHAPIFAAEQRSERGQRVVLRLGLDGPVGQANHRLDHKRRAGLGQHIKEVRRGLVRTDLHLLLQ